MGNASSQAQTLPRMQMLGADYAVMSYKNKWYMEGIYGDAAPELAKSIL